MNIYYDNIYANMNMKKTWQGYGAKLCLRLMLNKLKEMRGPFLFIPLWDLGQGSFYVCIKVRVN